MSEDELPTPSEEARRFSVILAEVLEMKWYDTAQMRQAAALFDTVHQSVIDRTRREALEEAKKQADERAKINRGFRDLAAASRDFRRAADFADAQAEALTISEMIHSLLTPTPQGESRVDQKRPPSPEDLVDALQDRVHPASGPLIQSKPVTPQGETKEND